VIGSGSEWSPSDEVLAAVGPREAFVRAFDAADPRLPELAQGRFRGVP
jgi:hypothetical protein